MLGVASPPTCVGLPPQACQALMYDPSMNFTHPTQEIETPTEFTHEDEQEVERLRFRLAELSFGHVEKVHEWWPYAAVPVFEKAGSRLQTTQPLIVEAAKRAGILVIPIVQT